MKCQRLSAKGNPCGHTAVAYWYNPVNGGWNLCRTHDEMLTRAGAPGWVRMRELRFENPVVAEVVQR